MSDVVIPLTVVVNLNEIIKINRGGTAYEATIVGQYGDKVLGRLALSQELIAINGVELRPAGD